MHRKVELVASVTNITNSCIEFLENEIIKSKDDGRVRSAYFTLIDIFLNNTNIDKKWLELFQEAFEIAIVDRTFKNHVKVFIKYLKILNNLKKNEMLLTKSIEMLNIYPKEYIPLDMICRIYTEKFNNTDFPFNVSCVLSNFLIFCLARFVDDDAFCVRRKSLAMMRSKYMPINCLQ